MADKNSIRHALPINIYFKKIISGSIIQDVTPYSPLYFAGARPYQGQSVLRLM